MFFSKIPRSGDQDRKEEVYFRLDDILPSAAFASKQSSQEKEKEGKEGKEAKEGKEGKEGKEKGEKQDEAVGAKVFFFSLLSHLLLFYLFFLLFEKDLKIFFSILLNKLNL